MFWPRRPNPHLPPKLNHSYKLSKRVLIISAVMSARHATPTFGLTFTRIHIIRALLPVLSLPSGRDAKAVTGRAKLTSRRAVAKPPSRGHFRLWDPNRYWMPASHVMARTSRARIFAV